MSGRDTADRNRFEVVQIDLTLTLTATRISKIIHFHKKC